jgi:hypothetical protein
MAGVSRGRRCNAASRRTGDPRGSRRRLSPIRGGLSLRRSDERLRAELPALACPRDRRTAMLRASRSALLQPSHASTEQRLACALWCAGRAWPVAARPTAWPRPFPGRAGRRPAPHHRRPQHPRGRPGPRRRWRHGDLSRIRCHGPGRGRDTRLSGDVQGAPRIGLLGCTSLGGIIYWVPLLMFVFLFGSSDVMAAERDVVIRAVLLARG